jgi:AcrR family transcriptional regulator
MVQSPSHLGEATRPVRPVRSTMESSSPPDPARPRLGRPRDERSHQAILDATMTLLSEIGYARLTIEGVASRAGTGKGTIYRRWSSKGALVVEAISGPFCPIATGKWTIHLGPLPDHGSLRADLLAFAERITWAMTVPLAREVLPGLAMDCSRDPQLAAAFRRFVAGPKRIRMTEVLARAAARGEARPDVDVDLLCDSLVGPVLYRAYLSGQPVDRPFLERLVDQVLPSIRASA